MAKNAMAHDASVKAAPDVTVHESWQYVVCLEIFKEFLTLAVKGACSFLAAAVFCSAYGICSETVWLFAPTATARLVSSSNRDASLVDPTHSEAKRVAQVRTGSSEVERIDTYSFSVNGNEYTIEVGAHSRASDISHDSTNHAIVDATLRIQYFGFNPNWNRVAGEGVRRLLWSLLGFCSCIVIYRVAVRWEHKFDWMESEGDYLA